MSLRFAFVLASLTALAACSDPQCPEPYEKVGNTCKCPAGTQSLNGSCMAVDEDSGFDSREGPVQAGDASAIDGSTPRDSDASTSVLPSDAQQPNVDVDAQPAILDAGSDAGSDASVPSDSGPPDATIPSGCMTSSCSGHGRCVTTGGSPRCECVAGYQGVDCSADVDECASAGHGCTTVYPCVNFAGGFTCRGKLADWPIPTHALSLPNPASYRADVANDTVLDEVTGLMWLRTPITGQTRTQAQQSCDALARAGFDDWRLPSMVEHASLLIPQQTPAINAAFVMPGNAWTVSPSSRAANESWVSNEVYGNTLDQCQSCAVNMTYAARCVRTHQRKYNGRPDERYVVDTQRKIVFDRATNLTWQRDIDEGAPPVRLAWEAARAHCDGLSYAGTDDWRLPTSAELVSTVDVTRSMPAYAAPFLGAATYAWTRDESRSSAGSAMFVGYDLGHLHPSVPTATYAARCVRLGQLQ